MEGLGVGVDLERVERFSRVRDTVFTAGELAHAGSRLESRAGIWCAKEAVVKAVSKWQQISVRQVEITYEGDRPAVRLPGFRLDVSISHAGEYAIAFAVAVQEE